MSAPPHPHPDPERTPATPTPSAETTARLMACVRRLALVGYGADSGVVAWDPRATDMLGYSAEEAMELCFASIHGDDMACDLFGDETQKGRLEAGQPLGVDIFGHTSVGERRVYHLTFQPAAPCEAPVAWWVAYQDLQAAPPRTSDAEEPSPCETQAERLRELLVNVVESLRGGLCLLDMSTRRIVYANDSFIRITGFAKLDLVGNTFECLLEKWEGWRRYLIPHLDEIARKGRGAGSAHWEVDLPSGRKVLEIYGQTVHSETDRPNFILLNVEDITEKQSLSHQLVQSEKLAAIGQLAAGIAHEIRSPLATIYNALYDLNTLIPSENSDAREDVEIASEEIARVQEIINNLLDFARESERRTEVVDVNAAIERTLRLLMKAFEKQGVVTRMDFRGAPQALISPNALKQILINLFTNASDAMPKGGRLTVVTEVRPGAVPFSKASHRAPSGIIDRGSEAGDSPVDSPAPQAENHVAILVTDTGHGIPESILPMIFNPFFTTKAPGQGTGLGLSVVHSQVQEHGGSIEVESTPGRGTTFTITLPAAVVEPPAKAPSAKSKRPRRTGASSPEGNGVGAARAGR